MEKKLKEKGIIFNEKFTPSKFAKSEIDHYEHMRTTGIYEYMTIEAILPYSPDIIWSVILDSEYMAYWLGNHTHGRPEPFPKPFGIGTEINLCSNSDSVTIISGELQNWQPRKSITLKSDDRFENYYNNYIKISVIQREPDLSRIELTFEFFRKRHFTDIFSRKTAYEYYDSRTEKFMKKIISRLKYCCHEEEIFGQHLLGNGFKNGLNIDSYIWPVSEVGKIYYYPDKSEKKTPYIGQELPDKSEIIAYVHIPQYGEDRSKEDYSIITKSKGYIAHIIKNAGDQVEQDVPVFLIAKDIETLNKIKTYHQLISG